MNKFLKKFNCPGRFFEVLGYITVIIGLIIFLVGVVNAVSGIGAYNSVGAPDNISLNRGIAGLSLILMGIITSVVAPQLFFAIAKIVRAAEKYLGE